LKKYLEKQGSLLWKEVLSHKLIYLILSLILILALAIRIYNTGTVLGFYYDQGRDALKIWNLLNKGDFFLLGPTTGIAGIFRGPYYYYLITPFYWISRGDPVLPADFLAFTSVIAIAFLFYLGAKLLNRATGIFAALIAGFSFNLMVASRWLSNPTPMLLLSVLLVWSLFLISKGKRYFWVLVSFLAGLSLFHFGSSGEFFYFPAILIFALWQRKYFPNAKIVFYSFLAFAFSLLPLFIFDLKNGFMLSKNIYAFIFEKESFSADILTVIENRVSYITSTFYSLLFPISTKHTTLIFFFIGICFVYFIPKFLKNNIAKIAILLFLSPLMGIFFFHGNEGNIYGYYMTGYYLIFVLLVSLVLGLLWKKNAGKLIVIAFFYLFFNANLPLIKSKITDNADGPNTILLGNQKQAIEWIYKDADDEFNVDIFVPPVIPYSYDYLFTWYESMPDFSGKTEERRELLYTLYEEDPPYAERLEEWLVRQSGIGQVEYGEKFGGITVERRKRIK